MLPPEAKLGFNDAVLSVRLTDEHSLRRTGIFRTRMNADILPTKRPK